MSEQKSEGQSYDSDNFFEDATHDEKGEVLKEWYQEVLLSLRTDGFEPTPAEAVFLRQVIRDCFEENNKIINAYKKNKKESMDALQTFYEIFERFFIQYYGVSPHNFLEIIRREDKKNAEKDLYKYIQEKLRKDKELI